MSYGWLTESAILPKKSKEIVVGDAGTVALQAAILDLRDKQKHGNKQSSGSKAREVKRNPGVDERNKRDELESLQSKTTQKNCYKSLQRKAAIYERIKEKKANLSTLLVDFQAKEELNRSKIEEQQYKRDRQAFYSQKIQAVEQQQQSIHDNIETEKSSLTQTRQRLAWERQMLNEMKGENEPALQTKVAQSFDKILSKEEKEALGAVVGEGMEQKMRLAQLRRRKQLAGEGKVRKLKNLNIIRKQPDDSEEKEKV